MTQEYGLTNEEQSTLEMVAAQGTLDAKRATALLALAAGNTQAEAAEAAGLTTGQVQYFAKKFREQRLGVFSAEELGMVSAETVLGGVDEASAEVKERVSDLLVELDELVEEMEETIPIEEETPYTPVGMLKLVRSYISKYTPDVQLTVLEQFEDMSLEDLADLETWKGIAYMIAYSAQFQASQTKDMMNEQLPHPLKPDTIFNFVRSTADRFTPEIAKDLAGNLQEASREDLMDPETWKGMLYMLGYSAQFQASQTKDKLNEQLPSPFKPDTWLNLARAGVNKVTPDVAREIFASFEGATREDLMDPDTWKGVWYMLNYSLQFQAEQLKERLMGETGADEDLDAAAAA